MSRAQRAVLAGLTAIALLSVAFAGGASPVFGAGHAVSIVDTYSEPYAAFSPRTIRIHVGDSVTWTNDSMTQHNVTSSAFRSPMYMDPGASYRNVFTRSGTFHYTCTLHNFSGTVIVRGAAAPIAAPAAKPTPKPTAVPAASAGTLTGTPSPSPSSVAVAASGAAPPSAAPPPPAAPASADSTLPLLLLFGLVALGVLGLAVFARRRT